MYVDFVTVKRKKKTHVKKLLRRSYRENGKPMKETLANLSHLPDELISVIRGYLSGKKYIHTAEKTPLKISAARSHGMVMAVKKAFEQLGFETMLASRTSRQRNIICAMVCVRIMKPHSKTASLRWWQNTTIPNMMGARKVEPKELFEAMDWLYKNQGKIEKRLAKKHLTSKSVALYDLSSSYMEGDHCELAQYGYSRDKGSDKKQINYGLLCDALGRPISMTVYEGNISDSKTLIPQITKIKEDFSLSEVIIVGDRGMIVKAQFEALKSLNIPWITALRSASIKKLIRQKAFIPSPELTLCEISHEDFPMERLIVCRNPEVASKRRKTRLALLQKTQELLAGVQERVERGTLTGKAEIGIEFGSALKKCGMKKHFRYSIDDDAVTFSRNSESIDFEASTDGIYIVRTSLQSERASSQTCVDTYKSLAKVERAFRCLKTGSLHVRPIYHRLDHRLRSHMFLCMLAYYVEWHLREAWAPLLFSKTETLVDQEDVDHHSYHTLLSEMNALTENDCYFNLGDPRLKANTFVTVSEPTEIQAESFQSFRRYR